MTEYLLLESRDPFEFTQVAQDFELASRLARAGNAVTLYLVNSGVLPARLGSACPELETMEPDGVEVLADDFSLRERGIAVSHLRRGVRVATIDEVVDQLAQGRKAIWL